MKPNDRTKRIAKEFLNNLLMVCAVMGIVAAGLSGVVGMVILIVNGHLFTALAIIVLVLAAAITFSDPKLGELK